MRVVSRTEHAWPVLTPLVIASAEEKQGLDEELLTFTHFAQYFAQRAQAKHAESASVAERLQQQQVNKCQ